MISATLQTGGKFTMFSNSMRAIYCRLLILGVLLAGVVYFGYFAQAANVAAAPAACMQDCEKYWQMCNDSCQYDCGPGSNDEACDSCLTTCAVLNDDCLEHSIWCSTGTVSYTPECETQYGIHCVVNGGVESCDPANGAHDGYSQLCNRIGYPNGCINCPTPGDPDENCYNGSTPGSTPQCL